MFELRDIIGTVWVHVYDLSQIVGAVLVDVYEPRVTGDAVWVYV